MSKKPLGITKPRSLVHQQGDWHKAVHVYVTNPHGQFLVHLRSPHKDLKPNMWDTRFGGHVLAGHDYDETALKELEEEIGLRVSLTDLILGARRQHDGGTNREHVQRYYYIFTGDITTLQFNDNEVVEVRWMSPEDITNAMALSPDDWTGKADSFKKVAEYFHKVQLKTAQA